MCEVVIHDIWICFACVDWAKDFQTRYTCRADKAIYAESFQFEVICFNREEKDQFQENNK